MSKKDPAFLLYSKDWLQGTSELMPEEKGVYIDLLCHQHQSGDLPSDTRRLAKIAGIGHDEFLKIWVALSSKFEPTALPNGEPNGERIGNRKLYQVMGERAENAKKNKVNGVFAAALRALKLSKKEYKFIRDQFKTDDFLHMADELTTEWLTEWCTERLTERSKSIEDGDEDVDEDIQDDNTLKGGAGGKQLIYPHQGKDFMEAWGLLVTEPKWRKKTHQALQTALNKLGEVTERDAISAIHDAIAGGWQGIFPKQTTKKHDDVSADKFKGMTAENYWNV